MIQEFDYIVVGAGSAGCVVASRLSEDPAVSVCLLEAGGPDKSPLIHVPAGLIFLLSGKFANWAYQTRISILGKTYFQTIQSHLRIILTAMGLVFCMTAHTQYTA